MTTLSMTTVWSMWWRLALREDEIIHSFVPEYAEGYDIIVVGKPTDNSGMGGAAFSLSR